MNLKTAARRMGVHYQTAYRWVRSGELIAVKVGSGYDISEAALERFRAQRTALERLPSNTELGPNWTVGSPMSTSAALDVLERMNEKVTTDARPVVDRATRIVADVLGDAVITYLRDETGDLRVAQVAHCEPESEVVGATVARSATRQNVLARKAVERGEPVFVPQVSQRDVRAHVYAEAHETLMHAGCFSAIGVPIGTQGVLFATRNLPGNPYTHDDLAFLDAVAARVGHAMARARRGWMSREIRRSVVRLMHEHAEHTESVEMLPRARLDALLQAAVADDAEAAVALLDLDLRHLVCTKAYWVLVGDDPAAVLGAPLLSSVAGSHVEALNGAFEHVLRGELDFRSVETELGPNAVPAALYVAMVRRRDARPWALVAVAHPLPAL